MYRLEKYKGARTRHECPYCHRPRCFTLYVDENGMALSPLVGKCDHEIKCGAHVKPKDFFKDHPSLAIPESWLKPMPETKRELMTIPMEQVDKFRTNKTTFAKWLIELFGNTEVLDAYKVGGLKSGETIFWQIDQEGRVRSGKCIRYGEDGHRIKNNGNEVTWMHSLLKKDGVLPKDFELTQCLFGEHLLTDGCTVGLVESEKTAIICSMVYPDKVWLATGGKNNLHGERMQVLLGHKVSVFADADAVNEWRERVTRMKSLGYDILCVDLHYTESQVENKYDLADLIIDGQRRTGKVVGFG